MTFINTSYLLAVSPFILFAALLLWKKMPLLKVSLIILFIIFVFQLFYWQIQPVFILSSFVKGFLIALDIFFIIFGAIFFLEVLKGLRIIEGITTYLGTFSKDHRVQVILLAWFFENFIEGTAGFGTPAIIVAPLLIGLGIAPINAVIISLLGNSASVAFGAAGTPSRIGFAGLDTSSVPVYTAAFNMVGLLVPVFMMWMLSLQQKNKRKFFLEILPFALWSGIVFVIPSFIVSFWGEEFPSIIGSVIGIMLILTTTKLGFLIPKNVEHLGQSEKEEVKTNKFKVLFPYALLILLLFVGKFTLGSIPITFPWGLKYSFNLFNPGFMFLIALIPVIFIWRENNIKIFKMSKHALKRTVEPFLIIVAMSTMVQLMINSGNNLTGLPSSLEIIAKGFEVKALPVLAPFVGMFGAAITGSATISNIMFGSLLNTASRVMNMNSSVILALELVGAAAGNMIALADVIVAEAAVGLKNQTRNVLKGVIIPCIIYVSIVGVIGFIVSNYF